MHSIVHTVFMPYGETPNRPKLCHNPVLAVNRRGGMFEYVSGGNYASEICEWAGFALAAGTLPAAAFALFTFCNLAPRAHHHHRWQSVPQ